MRSDRVLLKTCSVGPDQSDDLPRGVPALGCRAFHEALELDRGVLAAEQDAALPHPLVTAERRVLTDAVVRVRRLEERALVRQRLRGPAVPRQPRIDRCDL